MTSDKLKKELFSQFDGNVYAILDGASIPDLPQILWEMEPENVCLYRGKLEPDIASVAPYLVKLEHDHPFTKFVLDEGWGNHWGIFVITPAELEIKKIRQHFRKFLRVLSPESKPIYFRYYDPRVMRAYLPTCNAEEIKTIFGPIICYCMEDEEPSNMLQLSPDGQNVRIETINLTQ